MKTFLSIGTGPGIGLETAKRFAREGYRVVLSARNLHRLESFKAEIEALGAPAQVHQVDVTDGLSVDALVAGIGPDLDVLHYNAAVLHYDESDALAARTIDDETAASLQSDTLVNIAGALVAAKAALPAMRARKSGTILMTGGGFAVHPSGDYLSLSIGKAGIRAAAQGLFQTLEPEGIHVASVTVSALVAPGTKEAQGVAEAFWQLHSQAPGSWDWEAVYR